jgi:hypothetical protein
MVSASSLTTSSKGAAGCTVPDMTPDETYCASTSTQRVDLHHMPYDELLMHQRAAIHVVHPLVLEQCFEGRTAVGAGHSSCK